jgi:hypothetical protein
MNSKMAGERGIDTHHGRPGDIDGAYTWITHIAAWLSLGIGRQTASKQN